MVALKKKKLHQITLNILRVINEKNEENKIGRTQQENGVRKRKYLFKIYQ